MSPSPSPTEFLPFYFAWVDADQTTFDHSTMLVVDETILDMNMLHEEGQCATLDLTIKNPRIGLLNPGRKVWAWMSYQDPMTGHITPIFFGVLVGVPTNLFAEKIQIKLIARPSDYIEAKQATAETLKVAPYYDPVFLSEAKRDDPDAILEGWSSLYHVDRTSLEVSASDILVGEDGTVTFDGDQALYDSVSLTLDQPPLVDVQVQAEVKWTQRCQGVVPGPDVNIQSYTAETFMDDWPKPGTGIGGGWTVESSFVDDVYKVKQTPMAHSSSSWTNKDPDADDCSTDTISNSADWPALLSPDPLSAVLTGQSQSGVCDPVGSPPDEPPVNRPANIHLTGITVPLWTLNCNWTLRYAASRDFTELLVMDVKADTQSILTSPLVQQNTEVIKVSGADVGLPLETADAWTDFLGEPVGLGQVIFPNDSTTPGGLSYQIAVVAGIAGSTEPAFSDVPGTATVDNTVTWASLGETPETVQPQWQPAAPVGLGQIICYEPVEFDMSTGNLEPTGQSVFYLCTTPGETNSITSEITYIPPITDNDQSTPAPATFFYIAGPRFDTTPGDTITDGSVTWTSLGVTPPFLGIPLGGSMTQQTARCYFPTDRGQRSVQYLICRARARLRMRSRCVKVSWDCPIGLAINLSCRKNASVSDPRLPGGIAEGKIISYSLKANGEGSLRGHVEIGCPVGLGGSYTDVAGTPDYVAEGYVNVGYQQYLGVSTTIGEDDISYTPPAFVGFDDGLIFPLSQLPIMGQGISGSSAEQKAAIIASFPAEAVIANIGTMFDTQTTPGATSSSIDILTPSAAWTQAQQLLYWTSRATPYVMEAHPVSYEITINPVTNGPFNGAYAVQVETLKIPQGINLAADSTL